MTSSNSQATCQWPLSWPMVPRSKSETKSSFLALSCFSVPLSLCVCVSPPTNPTVPPVFTRGLHAAPYLPHPKISTVGVRKTSVSSETTTLPCSEELQGCVALNALGRNGHTLGMQNFSPVWRPQTRQMSEQPSIKAVPPPPTPQHTSVTPVPFKEHGAWE